jgi:predicted GNAT family acetyltransferase
VDGSTGQPLNCTGKKGYTGSIRLRLTLPPGHLAPARREDTDTLVSWIKGFSEDTGEEGNPEDILEAGLKNHTLFVWHDRKPVSMAASSRPTPNGICVNLVYTPPELRKQGYATATVSALSRMLLERGKSFCSLYTDLANPTSNSIYQKIGYRPVLDCYHYRFGKV